jgi:hypothetical protein
MSMFSRLHQDLQSSANVWADGYLTFDGGVNSVGTTDAAAVIAFLEARDEEPLFGKRQQLWISEESLHELAPNHARRYVTWLLREEAKLFSAAAPDEALLEALSSAFLAAFDSPVFFCNFELRHERSSSWKAVTKHSRDSLLLGIDRSQVGYWLSSDDE